MTDVVLNQYAMDDGMTGGKIQILAPTPEAAAATALRFVMAVLQGKAEEGEKAAAESKPRLIVPGDFRVPH